MIFSLLAAASFLFIALSCIRGPLPRAPSLSSFMRRRSWSSIVVASTTLVTPMIVARSPLVLASALGAVASPNRSRIGGGSWLVPLRFADIDRGRKILRDHVAGAEALSRERRVGSGIGNPDPRSRSGIRIGDPRSGSGIRDRDPRSASFRAACHPRRTALARALQHAGVFRNRL
jgi:hypothetical protein